MNNKQVTHPMHQQSDIIDERGLMVFDNITSMPLYHEPYITDRMTVTLNLNGWMKGECDMRPIHFRKHDIAIIPSRHILSAYKTSDDYHAILIVLSPAFQEEMKHRYPDVYRDLQHYHYRQDIPLNDRQFQQTLYIIHLLRDLSMDDSPHRTVILGDLLEVLFLKMQDYRKENGIDKHLPSLREELFSNFYDAIEEHYSESREVQFYANLFHLSPKYFSSVIKHQTGISALAWINKYTTIQAKNMLRRNKDTTIQQIASQLGFSDQAAFCRYFKQHTGVTPSDYRTMA